MRSLCAIGYRTMAIVKANTIKNTYNHKKIFQYFKIEANSKDTPQEISKKYIRYLASAYEGGSNDIRNKDIQSFLDANNDYKIIEFTKEQIAGYFKTMTPEAQKVIDNFFTYLSFTFGSFSISHRLRYKSKQKEKQVNQSLVQSLNYINQFFPLITLNKKNCMNYIRCISSIKKFFHSFEISEYFSNYRIAAEKLASLPLSEFSQEDLFSLFKNFAFSSIHHIHHEKSLEIVCHFWKGITPDWYRNPKTRMALMLSLDHLGCFSQQFLFKSEFILLEQFDSIETNQHLQILGTLMKFNRITDKNYEGKYKEVILKILEQHKKQKKLPEFFDKTYLYMYRLGLWLPQYWIQFFQFVKKDQGKKIQLYHLHVISRLFEIDKDIIPKQIVEAGQFIKDELLKDFSKDEMMKDFHNKQVNIKGVGCQVQLANSLRIINVGSVRTEVPIDFFIVDILINKNYVAEVNGSTHYLYNMQTLKKQYNGKTKFRSRVLRKLGYHVIEIDLEDYNESSFTLIRQVYDIVKNELTDEKDLELKP